MGRAMIDVHKLYYYKGIVTRVIDGDTICIKNLELGFGATLDMRVRLLGVNAPEMKGETLFAARAAQQFVVNKVLGNEVIIRTEKGDAFGRWLAIVYYYTNKEYKCLNDELIQEGFAVPYGQV